MCTFQNVSSVSLLYLCDHMRFWNVLLDFSLTVKAATLIFISGRGSAISSVKEGKSGAIFHQRVYDVFLS